jgi:CheY-like chemotaxis protein/anti-sigma regulatory factor (Ser/Thr protein kinase)
MPAILIVDDEPIHRELAHRFLMRLADLEVYFAESGEEALRRIEEHPLDLILTDLRMPGMSGLDLVRTIQEDCPYLPVVLMTGYGNETLAVRALTAGAASYVPKSEMAQSLSETVEQVLAVAQARRKREVIFQYIQLCETRFDIENDPSLIPPLIGYLQNNLQRLGFGNESTRTRVGLALMEAVSNAMIHGNLEVSSGLRKESQSDYFELVQRRRNQEPFSNRRVLISATESRDRIAYHIKDDGPGFDPASLPDPTSPDNMLRLSGRGLLLIRTFMDRVEFGGRGNEITLAKWV